VGIGTAIRELRELRGLTQQELGKRASVPWRTLQNWEQGRAPPGNLAALARLAAALGVSPARLLKHLGEPDERRPRGRPRKEKQP
jgi:transcriptional regulator with XRE-family HTH domain